MTIKLRNTQTDQHSELRELIPNPDGIQPVEYCQGCGRTSEIFWNGYYMLCMDCQKNASIARKLKVPLVDGGIPLVEFFYRLQNRVILYGWVAWEEIYGLGEGVAHNTDSQPSPRSNSPRFSGAHKSIKIGGRTYE